MSRGAMEHPGDRFAIEVADETDGRDRCSMRPFISGLRSLPVGAALHLFRRDAPGHAPAVFGRARADSNNTSKSGQLALVTGLKVELCRAQAKLSLAARRAAKTADGSTSGSRPMASASSGRSARRKGLVRFLHPHAHRNGELALGAHAVDLGSTDIERGVLAGRRLRAKRALVARVFVAAEHQRVVGQGAQGFEAFPHRAGLSLEHPSAAHREQRIGGEDVAVGGIVERDLPERVAGRRDDDEGGGAERDRVVAADGDVEPEDLFGFGAGARDGDVELAT